MPRLDERHMGCKKCKFINTYDYYEYEYRQGYFVIYPFIHCTNIKTFEFGSEVESIPSYLCLGLTGLTSLTIPNSVTTIGIGPFYGCSGLTSVTWDAKNVRSIIIGMNMNMILFILFLNAPTSRHLSSAARLRKSPLTYATA